MNVTPVKLDALDWLPQTEGYGRLTGEKCAAASATEHYMIMTQPDWAWAYFVRGADPDSPEVFHKVAGDDWNESEAEMMAHAQHWASHGDHLESL